MNLCNKLYNITNNKDWFQKIDILKKSFHQVLNSNFSQMFSFIKILDVINENISFTFYGNSMEIKKIKKKLYKDYVGKVTFIYKNLNDNQSYVVICKNQTCSNKLSTINEIDKYLKESNIN